MRLRLTSIIIAYKRLIVTRNKGNHIMESQELENQRKIAKLFEL